MKRFAEADLEKWLNKNNRKPLVLRGARQVGKTWSVRNLAESQSMDLVELNFEKNSTLKAIFESNAPSEYVSLLEMHLGRSLNIANTLLFLDEIQAFPEMLAKLRWLYEDMPDLAVIATGSLLDFTLADHTFSMPVGRISYYYLEPFSFNEFLCVTGHDRLLNMLNSMTVDEISGENSINPLIHKKLLDLFKVYSVVGGMPEALNTWIETNSFAEVSVVQQELLATYRDDFAKYSAKSPKEVLDDVMRSIPRMLGNKVKYSNISRELRSDVVKRALNLLCTARICHKVFSVTADGIPLGATVKNSKFKTVFLDTGLVSASLGLQLNAQMKSTDLVLVNKGALAEQVVGQLLRMVEPYCTEPSLYYWARDKKGSEAEVDYVIQAGTVIVPVEVKAGSTGSMKSLHALMAHKGLSHAVRINSDIPSVVDVNYKIHGLGQADYSLLSLPVYMTEQLKRLSMEFIVPVR